MNTWEILGAIGLVLLAGFVLIPCILYFFYIMFKAWNEMIDWFLSRGWRY